MRYEYSSSNINNAFFALRTGYRLKSFKTFVFSLTTRVSEFSCSVFIGAFGAAREN